MGWLGRWAGRLGGWAIHALAGRVGWSTFVLVACVGRHESMMRSLLVDDEKFVG